MSVLPNGNLELVFMILLPVKGEAATPGRSENIQKDFYLLPYSSEIEHPLLFSLLGKKFPNVKVDQSLGIT